MESEYSELFKKNLDRDDWNCFIRGYKNPNKLLKLVPNNPMNNKGIPLGTTKDFSVEEISKIDITNMEKNEIKKALYKQNPEAKYLYAKKGNLYYGTQIPALDGVGFSAILFTIPFEDIGDATFNTVMDAKLLIRWII